MLSNGLPNLWKNGSVFVLGFKKKKNKGFKFGFGVFEKLKNVSVSGSGFSKNLKKVRVRLLKENGFRFGSAKIH